jgi:hypothetical protein
MLGRRARQGHERLAEALRAAGRRFSAPALCWSPPPPRRYPHASRARPHNLGLGQPQHSGGDTDDRCVAHLSIEARQL